MPSISQTIQMRNRRREASNRNPAFSIGLLMAVLISLLITTSSLYLALEYSKISNDLPAVDGLPELLEPPGALVLQPTRFFDRTGEHLIATIQNPAAGERKYLYYPGGANTLASTEKTDLLPSTLISATIASTDILSTNPNFPFAISWLFGKHTSISERLAYEFLLQDEPAGLRRTIRQKLLGSQITHSYGAEKVIEWYLNNADFGRLAYGVEAGAQLYFGKHAQELDFSEAALLLTIAEDQDPDTFQLTQSAIARQEEIIQEAFHLRLLSPQQGINAIREKPEISTSGRQQFSDFIISDLSEISPAYIRLVIEQVTTRFTRKLLERGGFQVFTTLDYDLQAQVECTVRVQQARSSVDPASNSVGIPIDCPAARLLPTLPTIAGAKSHKISLESIIIDPTSGQILSMTGVMEDGKSSTILGEHPVGSMGRAFIYLTGFTRGLSPATLLWDVPAPESPEAEETVSIYHGPVRLRVAFANNYLAPAESVLSQVGSENVRRTTEQLGIEYPEAETADTSSILSLFRPMDLMEISYAFSTFPNQGELVGHAIEPTSQSSAVIYLPESPLPPLRPTAVLFVKDLAGQMRLDWRESQSRPILTSALAYLMTNVMSDETVRWSSLGHPNSLEVGRPAAVISGNDLNGNSNWVIGYTPKRVVGVWLGSAEENNPGENNKADLSALTSGFWHAIVQYGNQNLPYEDFPMPTGLSVVQVCDPSGMLPTAACPNVVDEVFLSGDEPVQLDTLYQLMAINRNTNQLATIFTPPDLVEERSFLIVPSEAQKWARQAGWETPPETYDPLPAKFNTWADTRISSPQMFAAVHGQITVSGRAAGPGFSYFRLQYGKGPNPSEWFQIGSDANQPVSDGKLLSWDTSGLDGLYAIQLLLVRNDQSVERATVLVTVDNQPPLVKIIRPFTSETIQQLEKKQIVLQTEISDNLQVSSVVFEIDGQKLATLTLPPFAISWTVTLGEHTLKVSAEDSAGNQSSLEVKFLVQ